MRGKGVALPFLILAATAPSSAQQLATSTPTAAVAPENQAGARILGWIVRVVPDRTVTLRTGDHREIEWPIRRGTTLPDGLDAGNLVRVSTARSEWGTVEAVAVDVLRSDDGSAPGEPASDRQAGPFPDAPDSTGVTAEEIAGAPVGAAPLPNGSPRPKPPLDAVWFAAKTPLRVRVLAVLPIGLRVKRTDGAVETAIPVKAGVIPKGLRPGSVVDLYTSRGEAGELMLRRVVFPPTKPR